MSEQQPGPYGGTPPQQPTGGNGPDPYGYPQQGPYASPQAGPYGTPPRQEGGQQQPNPYAQGGGAPSPYPPPGPQDRPGQAGPYGQPGPYGPQGPYGEQNPYGQQPGPYGQQVPQQGHGPGFPGSPQAGGPRGGGKGKRNGLIIGGAVVVVALAVGAYFVLAGSEDSSGLPDDGPHKLTAPQTVLGSYDKTKDGSSGDDDFSEDDVAQMKKLGVDADVEETLSADYQSADPSTAQTMADLKKIDLLSYAGAYGSLKNPDRAVDALFEVLEKESKKNDGKDRPAFIGSPEEYKPAGGEGAIFKCQRATGEMAGGGRNGVPEKMKIAVCAWADHSTMGVAMPSNLGEVMLEEAPSLPKAAELTAKLRKEVRVEK
jgi:hypothetical protein